MNVFGDYYDGPGDINDDGKPEAAPQSGEIPKPEVKPGIPMKIPKASPFVGPGGM